MHSNRAAWVLFAVGALGSAVLGGCSGSPSGLDFTATPAEGEAPLSVAFSLVFSRDISRCEWAFGDGGLSTEQSPTHTYEYAGSYTVALTIVPVHGSALSVSRPDAIRVSGESAPHLVFWSERGTGTISRGERDGMQQETIVSGLISPEDLAAAGSRIYWTDYGTGRVESANLDGTGRVLIASGLHSPTGIAVDALGGKVYWTVLPSGPSDAKPADGRIQRANLDGSDVETLVSFSPDEPFAWQIAVDSAAQRLYWISLSWEALDSGACDGRIIEASLDGASLAVVASGLCDPTDLTTDGTALRPAGYVYWTSEEPGAVYRVPVLGGRVTQVVASIPDAESVAVDPAEGRIYWTAGAVLQSSSIDGSDVETLFTGLFLPEGIAVDP